MNQSNTIKGDNKIRPKTPKEREFLKNIETPLLKILSIMSFSPDVLSVARLLQELQDNGAFTVGILIEGGQGGYLLVPLPSIVRSRRETLAQIYCGLDVLDQVPEVPPLTETG